MVFEIATISVRELRSSVAYHRLLITDEPVVPPTIVDSFASSFVLNCCVPWTYHHQHAHLSGLGELKEPPLPQLQGHVDYDVVQAVLRSRFSGTTTNWTC